MARPKTDNPKDKGIRIRLTKEELEMLHRKAKERNMTISDLIRSIIFYGGE